MRHAPTEHAWRQPLGDRQLRRIDRFCGEVGELAGNTLAPGLDTIDIFKLQEEDAAVGRHAGRDFKRLAEGKADLAECNATQAKRHGHYASCLGLTSAQS